MSQFPINLNLQVSGQSKLQRAITSVKQLEQNLSRIKAIDLTKAMGGPTGDKIATLVTKFKGYAKNLEQTNKKQITTIAQAEALQATFRELSANVKVGSSAFMLFNKAAEEQGQVVKKLKNEYENLVRASKGMQTIEQREAQLARRKELIKKLKQQRREKEKETAARERNAKAAEREARAQQKLNQRLDRERKLAAEKRKRQRGRAFGDLAASVGFPLLFGGGVGSVAGGAIGSLAGTALGMGFGGQILGSAFGQSLDKAAQAANEFALAATKASTSIDALIQGFGLAGTSTATTLRFAETLGIGGAARAATQGGLVGIVGKNGVKNLENLATSAEDAGNALNRFGAATTAAFAPILTNLNQAIIGLFGGISKVEELRRATDPANQTFIESGGPGAAARQEFQRARAAKISSLSQDPEVKAQLELEKKINKVRNDRIELAKQAADLEGSRLTSRRDTFAVEQGSLAVQAQQNKLDVLAIQLGGKLEATKRRELELERDLTEEAKRQAEAARDNARIEAERQIQREQISGAISKIGMLQKEKDMQLQFNQRQQGRFELVEEEARAIEDRFNVNEMLLELENKRALIGVTEAERISDINRSFQIRKRLATEQYYLDLQSLEQANAAYQLSRLQFEQELKLQNLRAGMAAEQQIRQTSPFERETELLDPYFGGSRQLETDQQAAFTEQLGLMERQLGDVIKQQEIFALSPTVRKGLEDQEAKIRNQIANFKEYQPAIDEAALAQMRFNEAMALTVPVTDSLFDNLVAVAEGTKTAKEAFADFLRDIASLLFDAAKQMIATYIAIGIARAFAGMGSGESATLQTGPGQGLTSSFTDVNPNVLGSLGYAEGGYVSSPTRALVGEGGEPEYIIPQSKMRESMARYSRGARGSAVIPGSGDSGASGEGGGTAVAAPIDVRYSVERINNVDYVTAEEFQAGMKQAAAQGAQRGQQLTLSRLQQSPATRRRIGL